MKSTQEILRQTWGDLEDRSTIKQLLVENLNSEGINLKDYVTAYKAFDRAYFDAREHYISHYARGIISTAATAVDRMFRYFNSHTVVIEEASQMTEALAVAKMSRSSTSVRKVVLVGDINQNNPFTLDLLSEFNVTNETSLMQRLMNHISESLS